MRFKFSASRHATLLWGMLAPLGASAAVTVTGLQCEYRAEPLGIDARQPRLGWKLNSSDRAQNQTAYQVLVASSPGLLNNDEGDLWDSGKVASSQSIQVVYSGRPLVSGQRCYWKVRAWDRDENMSPWSQPARWTMGLLNPDDWQAEWIGFFPEETGQEGTPAPYFRKTFTLNEAADHAFAHINAQGYYELYVNGRKVDDHVLSPAVSDFRKRNLTITHDIHSYLQPGTNCVALWLGRGWYARKVPGVLHDGPIVRAQLDIATEHGSRQVVTDGSWKAQISPLSTCGDGFMRNYGADVYDATMEIPGWNTADLDDRDWPAAQVVSSHPDAVTVAQAVEPNRATEQIRPVSITHMEDGAYLVDMGRDFTGWFDIRFPRGGPAGTVVSMTCSESGGPPGGTVGLDYNQTPKYIFRGSGDEMYRMRFSYHGFRYIRISGAPHKPELEDITGYLVETDLPQAGSFACSNDLFNRIHEMTAWTARCLNLGGNTVDCPHRERLGYGDGQVVLEPLMYNHHAASLYYKWHADWRDAQDPETGEVPNVVPFFFDRAGGGPAWGGTMVPMAWYQYRHYGDTRILEEALPHAKAYLAFFESKSRDNILEFYGFSKKWSFLGDWVPPGGGQERGGKWDDETSTLFFNNCYRLYLAQLTARMAEVLGKTADAEQLHAKIEELRALLHERFYDPEAKTYVCGKQTYLAFPLMTGLPPPEERAAIMARLEQNIRGADKGHINAGMLGGYFMFDYLTSIDRDDLISLMVGQTTYPSWGYMLEQGATTCWEQWNGVFSHIHSCFVWVDLWFYEGLAGIHRHPDTPAFKHTVIKPKMVDGVTWVECHHDSPYGRIVSNWKRNDNHVTMDVTIPANSTATVYVPARKASDVRESGRKTGNAEGVRFLRMENGRAVYEVGSGAYTFTSTMSTGRVRMPVMGSS